MTQENIDMYNDIYNDIYIMIYIYVYIYMYIYIYIYIYYIYIYISLSQVFSNDLTLPEAADEGVGVVCTVS